MKAKTIIEDGWKRLYVTIAGKAFNVELAKEIFLSQGLAPMPPEWPGKTEEREIFTDLGDEESPSEWFTGSTDPIVVALVIRASLAPVGPIEIPTADEALGEISALRRKIIARK